MATVSWAGQGPPCCRRPISTAARSIHPQPSNPCHQSTFAPHPTHLPIHPHTLNHRSGHSPIPLLSVHLTCPPTYQSGSPAHQLANSVRPSVRPFLSTCPPACPPAHLPTCQPTHAHFRPPSRLLPHSLRKSQRHHAPNNLLRSLLEGEAPTMPPFSSHQSAHTIECIISRTMVYVQSLRSSFLLPFDCLGGQR